MSRASTDSVILNSSGGLVYQDATVPGGNTIANQSGSDVAFASTYTIPANTLSVGDVIRIKLFGVYGTTLIGPTVVGKLKFGSTTITTTGTVTSVAGVTNGGWSADMLLIVTAIGGSGTIEAQGYVEFSTAATTALSVNMANTAAKTVDTTVSQVITITINWGTTDAANTITLREMVVELFNNESIIGATAGGDLIGTYPNPSIKNSVSLTGTPTAPTAAAVTNSTQIATTAFVKSVHYFNSVSTYLNSLVPADASTYHFGPILTTALPVSSGGARQYAVPEDCTLYGYEIVTWAASTPTQETSTVSIRINNTTDVQLSNAVTFNATTQTSNSFSATNLSTDLTAGDKYEIKWVTPTWATNPTGSNTMVVTLYFRSR